ncbi:MAG: hypothetical protein H6654_15350 [Ardenticatenaceae bacterium]|nr:hypothetical protein [Anaerolineales bacterium]MCB8939642.1 hypothetical protein [Ardenticatenaceae bacterium]MCB8974933.1 hypothetical protein [Ardenticatenaceae bacterium]
MIDMPANNNSSRVFFNGGGYVEMRFEGIIGPSELRHLLYEMNQLVEVNGPTGVLLDGRNGRLNHDAGTLLALSETSFSPQLTHMVVLTHISSSRRDVIVKNPQGLVTQISAQALGVPLVYMSNEAEARRWAASGG